ncbi:MAG: hypothetical protein IH805_07415 [Proteobacteria bacterium]|nr:hypothetical protein [Pseudomonadota bacterium]
MLSSKGYSTRAVRDLLDFMGETDEPALYFCVHDADAAGGRILETLVGETLARPGRKVEVINLGLEPWEAVEMGLDVEPVKYEKRQPAECYIHQPCNTR